MSFELISTVTVGSGGAASIDFNSIAATYTDLQLVISGRSTRASSSIDVVRMTFNGTTSTYSDRALFGNGSSASSNTANGDSVSIGIGQVGASSSTSNTFSNIAAYIPNYAGATNKAVSSDSVEEENTTSAYSFLVAGLWSSTAAITSIKLALKYGNWAEYSTASLYGILKGSGGATVS